jgi:ribosomal protein S18 acetylase RimI-like enzyme
VGIIRRAVQGDALTLAALARGAYARYVERIGREPAPMTENYLGLVRAGEVWVAEHDGVVAGLLVLKVKPDHVLLDNVAVSPDFQGMGVGAQLLDFTESYAREHGLAEVRLYTNEAMTENLTYYPRHGYAETRRAVDHGYRRVFFTKRLR